MRGVVAAALACAAACRPSPPPLDSCADPLAGVWLVPGARTPSGEPRRYHVVDLGTSIEIYPMFDDSLLAPGDRKDTTPDAVIVAPASFDLTRASDGTALVGSQTRRFQRGAASCLLHTPARLHACQDAGAELEQTPVAAPTDWAACTPGRAVPERWTLVRERP